ncbi:hypothetical protein WJX72_005919 [[Myrmecia] bisecta]|uniref:Bifunctional lysine-specific demethylase and histidyl-hydroxylase n=1 Tax=[Myrmecia] bisecta TaxID=41462 RepID=A0AAW1QFE6_9CHLO
MGKGKQPVAKRRKVEPAGDMFRELDHDPLAYLVAPLAEQDFLENNFEQAPVHLKASQARQKVFSALFSKDSLDSIAKAKAKGKGPLRFGLDVNAAKYSDGLRKTLNPEAQAADAKALNKLFAGGCTLQLHQPQRFAEGLWRLCAALERQLGCLVGSNAYLTPAGSQGLAPHHDDVEIFVCQTEGQKRWRLYKPVGGFKLPNECSGDLDPADLGEPTMEVTLQPGDVLYLPRGTVHQAEAQEGHSTHITLSTYQHWSNADLAQRVLGAAMAVQKEATGLPLPLRQGLPVGFLEHFGVQAVARQDHGDGGKAAAALAAGLRALADQVEERPAEMLMLAADDLSEDFMHARAPPHPCQLPDQGGEPTITSKVYCRGQGWFRVMNRRVGSPADGQDSEDEADEENDNHAHGNGHKESEEDEEDEEEETLIFPEAFGPTIAKLLASMQDQPVAVKDIQLPGREGSEEDLAEFAAYLWKSGVLCTS